MVVLPLLPDLLLKQEMQEIGYRIANGLVERVAARLIRQLLLEDMPETVRPAAKPSLPAAQF